MFKYNIIMLTVPVYCIECNQSCICVNKLTKESVKCDSMVW